MNLNLLIALDALLSEQHVSRAATRIGITQSALSNALNKLREIFEDDLLVRGKSGMVLTPRALELIDPVRNILSEATALINAHKFNPEESEHVFRIGVSDYIAFIFLPSLVKKLNKLAPKVKLFAKHFTFFSPNHNLETEGLDIAIGSFSKVPDHLFKQQLFSDSFVCIASKDNPLLKNKLTLKTYLQAKHILVKFWEENTATITEKTLADLSHSRKVAITVPYIVPAFWLLPNSDYLLTMLKAATVPFINQLGLKLCMPPFKIPNIEYSQVWHRKYQTNKAHLWLRKLIKETADEIKSPVRSP